MKHPFPLRPAIAALTLVATMSTLVAPLAEASHVRNGASRYKGAPSAPVVQYQAPHRGVVVQRHSDAAPLLAGLIGGFILGTVVSNSQPVVHASYSYWDPYCESNFSSLDGYRAHIRRHHHPRVVRVVEISSGHYVNDLCWSNDGWRDYHGDWRRAGNRYRGDWDD